MFDLSGSELQKLGLKHKTAKAHPAIGYLPIYESLFQIFKNAEIQMMELGAGPVKTIGASFYMWRDYFSRAQIIGVDNKNEAEAVSDLESGRIKIEIGDLGSDAFLKYLSATYAPDIIIDDASHFWVHQITSFEALFPSLKPGGIYVVEDMHTSFGDLRASYGNETGHDAFTYFSTLSTIICGRNEPHPSLVRQEPTTTQIALAESIDLIVFARRLVIMYKSRKLHKKHK